MFKIIYMYIICILQFSFLLLLLYISKGKTWRVATLSPLIFSKSDSMKAKNNIIQSSSVIRKWYYKYYLIEMMNYHKMYNTDTTTTTNTTNIRSDSDSEKHSLECCMNSYLNQTLMQFFEYYRDAFLLNHYKCNRII